MVLDEENTLQKKNRIEKEKKRWEKNVLEPMLARWPERNEEFITTSSVPVSRLHIPHGHEDAQYLEKLGFPGQFPFTRGVQPTMYRGRLWTMRQFAGFGMAEETNQRFKFLIDHGETGLSIAFDYPTLYGYDSDHPLAIGEFGKCGVAVSSLKDMEILFEGIDLEKISTSMTINGPASVLWAFYIAMAEKKGVPKEKLRGTIQNDILKEYIAQKSFIFPPEPSMRLIVDTFEYGSKHLPQWNTVSISGYHIREAGSTAVQELAFTLGDGLEYVRAAMKRGLDIDEFAPRLSFFFNAHNDFFEEIAKYRAARRIWAREMKETFGARNPRSWMLRFHTQTAGCSLTAQQLEVNLVRVTIQALAAVLGGTQSLHTNSMDEALALPSEKAVRLALRTQQVVSHESGVSNTIDALGGSYYVEQLTDKMEREAYAYFEKIEGLGGVIPSLEKGFFQKEIADAAIRYQREIDARTRVIVGVNQFETNEPLSIPLLKMDPLGEKKQFARLEKLRNERDNNEVQKTLERLRQVARSSENTMPAILDCARAYATLGEITAVFREEFGEYVDPVIF